MVSRLREWRRDQKCAGAGAGGCCRVVKRRGRVNYLAAEVRRISLRGRIHVESVNERANGGIAGTEGLNGGRRHACAAGSGKQASTSTHTSTHPPYYLRICHTIFSKASRMPATVGVVLPRFLRILRLDWLEGVLLGTRTRTRQVAELSLCVEVTVKSTPTCIKCRDKILFPNKAWVWKLLYQPHFTYLLGHILLLALWYLCSIARL